MTDLTMGQRIAERRKKLGLSQEGLGEKVGVSRQAISKWESDGAVPEIDKLISLSKLFRVSVGWLLGVETLPEKKENELSEEQLKVVGELVKQTQPAPRSEWRTVAAMAVTVIALLISFVVAKQLHDTALQPSAFENQVSSLESQLQDISTRLAVLESAASHTNYQLLANYTIDILPSVSKKDEARKAAVTFTAAPSAWNGGDTGYLSVRGGSMDSFRTACDWDGSHLSATVNLDVADGYELCFVVEHENGTQEQQLLENATVEQLESAFTIPMEVTPGKFTFKNGVLTLSDYSAVFGMPSIYLAQDQSGETWPAWGKCEYRLYRKPADDSQLEIVTDNMRDYVSFLPDGTCCIQNRLIQFRDIPIENTDHLQLWFYAELSNGISQKYLVTMFAPDKNGGLKEMQ